MTLSRRILAKVDGRLRSEMDHTEGVQLVKVPVSNAVWSTWRRYCDLAGVPMGRGLAILLRNELASIVDEDLESLNSKIEARESDVDTRAKELAKRERDLGRRQRDLAVRESELLEGADLVDVNHSLLRCEVAACVTIASSKPSPTKSP